MATTFDAIMHSAVVQLVVSFNSGSQWILPRELFFVSSPEPKAHRWAYGSGELIV